MKKSYLSDLVLRNRSYRRFDGRKRMPSAELRGLVALARLAPTGGNRQSLRYRLINSVSGCETVFPHLAWAGYLKDWEGPAAHERPTAYIVILNDSRVCESAGSDAGIAAQTIMLGAVAAGWGGCMIGSVSRGNLHKELKLAKHLQIALVLALGKPVETVKLTRVRNGDIRYWRDRDGVHYVPKLSLRDLIV